MSFRIAVRVRDAEHARIAWAVASHPLAGVVGMVGKRPPSAWKGLVRHEDESTGYDVVVDPSPEDRAMVVVVAGTSELPSVTNASPMGLARVLATLVPGSTPVWTVVGRPRTNGLAVTMPPPIGRVHADRDGRIPIEGPLAAVGAMGAESRVVVDDRKFLEALCIAAGAFVAEGVTSPTPVWERAEAYLEACETLGLVVAGT
jgi:hypothetical protein